MDCQSKLEAHLEQRTAAEQTFLDKYLVTATQQHDLNDASSRAAADVHEQLRDR